MPEKAGQINQYVCEKCGYTITTVNRDPGTTPAFLLCKAGTDCTDDMPSSWYRVPEGLVPTWEWYEPQPNEQRNLSPSLREYVERGGLLLRETEKAPDPVNAELRGQLVEKLGDWLGEDGRMFFAAVKKEFGTLIATLPVGHPYNEHDVPRCIHFRDGMKVRNFLRESITLDLPDDWYDDSWAGLVEEAIEEDEEIPDVYYDADVIHHVPDPDVNTRWVKGVDDE